MKRYIIPLLMLAGVLVAQTWNVRLIPAPPTQLYIESMWICNITNNETRPVDVTLYAWAVKNGLEIAHARCNVITIPPGGKRITSSDITAIHDKWFLEEYEGIINRRGALPPGNYKYCVQVELVIGGTILAQDCAEHRGITPSPPRLLAPAKGAEFNNPQPTFVWIPPVPPPKDLTYRFRIVKVPEYMTPDEAMSAAEPWFEQDRITTTSLLYPMGARPFEIGEEYVWQVTALLGDWTIAESEVWSFNFSEVAVRLPAPEELYAIELISPEDGAMIGTNPTFEWTLLDTTAIAKVTFTAEPEKPIDSIGTSYNLTIWKISEDLAKADLDDFEPYYVKKGILGSSLTVDARDFEPGTYGWQVEAFDVAGNTISESGTWSFKFDEEIQIQDKPEAKKEPKPQTFTLWGHIDTVVGNNITINEYDDGQLVKIGVKKIQINSDLKVSPNGIKLKKCMWIEIFGMIESGKCVADRMNVVDEFKLKSRRAAIYLINRALGTLNKLSYKRGEPHNAYQCKVSHEMALEALQSDPPDIERAKKLLEYAIAEAYAIESLKKDVKDKIIETTKNAFFALQ